MVLWCVLPWVAALAACGGSPSAAGTASDSPTDCFPSATLATDAAPSSATGQPENPCDTDLPDAEESSDSASASGSSGASTPTASGAADQACLTSRTWHISKTDLESQMQSVMSSKMQGGAQVDSVQIVSGDQTVSVTPGLKATFTDDTVTVIKAHFDANGTRLNMVIKQTHQGSASGGWQADGAILNPTGGWSGGITGTTETTVNGRSGSAPFSGGAPDAWSQLKLNYSCENGSLMLTVPGVSPFNYLFR